MPMIRQAAGIVRHTRACDEIYGFNTNKDIAMDRAEDIAEEAARIYGHGSSRDYGHGSTSVYAASFKIKAKALRRKI